MSSSVPTTRMMKPKGRRTVSSDLWEIP